MLASVDTVGSDVVVSFANWSAPGLALKDVHAMNNPPHGPPTNNSCRLCCAQAPPFDVQIGSDPTGNWTAVSLANTVIDRTASTVTLKGDFAAAVGAVRYAWRDYVECVLVNNDGLPLSPFAVSVSSPAPVSMAKVRKATGKQMTPPMGFNSWNFYHCNIDEVTVRGIIDAISTNGMREAGTPT